MTTTYQSGYDLDYRPETYWPDDPTIKALSTVKGEARRRVIHFRVAHEDRSVLADPMSDSSLPDAEREAAGAVHPCFMGGEYLPNLLPREVEIARISLESTTYDVISIRARLARTRIHYRIVDEYDTDYKVSPQTSRQPLSLRQIIHLMQEGGSNSHPERLREMQIEGGAEAEEVVHFASVSSAFYPMLDTYYTEEAAIWLDEYLEDALDSEFAEDDEEEYQRRLGRHPWESPWAFSGCNVDEMDPVDARMLSHGLQEQTGDPEA